MPYPIPVDESGNPLPANLPGVTVSSRLAQLAAPPSRKPIRVDEYGQPIAEGSDIETAMPNWFNQHVTSRFPSLATVPAGAIRVDEAAQPLATTETLQNVLTRLFGGGGR